MTAVTWRDEVVDAFPGWAISGRIVLLCAKDALWTLLRRVWDLSRCSDVLTKLPLQGMVQLVEVCLSEVWAGAGVCVTQDWGRAGWLRMGGLGVCGGPREKEAHGCWWREGEGGNRRVYKGSLWLSQSAPGSHLQLTSIHGAAAAAPPAAWDGAEPLSHLDLLSQRVCIWARSQGFSVHSQVWEVLTKLPLPTFTWDAFSCKDKNPTQTSPSIKKMLISSSNQTEEARCYWAEPRASHAVRAQLPFIRLLLLLLPPPSPPLSSPPCPSTPPLVPLLSLSSPGKLAPFSENVLPVSLELWPQTPLNVHPYNLKVEWRQKEICFLPVSVRAFLGKDSEPRPSLGCALSPRPIPLAGKRGICSQCIYTTRDRSRVLLDEKGEGVLRKQLLPQPVFQKLQWHQPTLPAKT